MKSAITILSYCDTTFKKELLQSLIKRVKMLYPSHKVLVYSHYPNVEPKYYEQSDYYIYDNSNPQSPREFYHWTFIPQIGKKFYIRNDDFGLAVIQMIKRSSLFLDSIGIENSLFLNYDMNLDEATSIKLIDISEFLITNNSIFTPWGPNEFSLCYFWLNIKSIGRDFFNSITKEKYLSYDTSFIAERIFREIMTEGIGHGCLFLNTSLNGRGFSEFGGKVSGVSRKINPDNQSIEICDYFETIFGTLDPDTKEKYITIWGAKVPIESITIEIDNIEYLINNELENKNFLLSKLPDVNIEEIKITSVNSIALKSTYTMESLSESYWIRNFHVSP